MGVFLAVIVILSGLVLFQQYNQTQEFKRDILGQYIMSQHNISSYLTNAIEHNDKGNTEGFVISLHHASREFHIVTNIISNGTLLGQHVKFPQRIWIEHIHGMDMINDYFIKSLTEELTTHEIENIRVYAERMNWFTEHLHFEEIISGRSPQDILDDIELFLVKEM